MQSADRAEASRLKAIILIPFIALTFLIALTGRAIGAPELKDTCSVSCFPSVLRIYQIEESTDSDTLVRQEMTVFPGLRLILDVAYQEHASGYLACGEIRIHGDRPRLVHDQPTALRACVGFGLSLYRAEWRSPKGPLQSVQCYKRLDVKSPLHTYVMDPSLVPTSALERRHTEMN